jgi:hypothetical protein
MNKDICMQEILEGCFKNFVIREVSNVRWNTIKDLNTTAVNYCLIYSQICLKYMEVTTLPNVYTVSLLT